MKDLLSSLLTVDKTLSANKEKALLLEADELFNIVFKLTYYDDVETCICNAPLSALTKNV